MAETEKTEKANQSAKASAAKASAAKASAANESDDGDETDVKVAKTPKKPKRPTGNFVAKMNLDVLNPRLKKDAGGNWVGGRHTVAEGQVVPSFVSENELAKFQEQGAIDHEYA